MDNNKALSMDSYIFLSWINTKLRDEFNNLSILCEEYDIERQAIMNKLKTIGYVYNENNNQFILL
jgi:hypothetical protein